MKKILLGLFAVMVSASVGFAATAVSDMTTATNYVLISTGGKVLKSVTIVPNGTNATFRLYDKENTTLTYTNAAYTVRYLTNATVVTSFVDYGGNTNNFTNTALIYATNSVSASTNAVTPFATVLVGGSAVETLDLSQVLTKGLVISNTSSATVLAVYDNQ